MEVILHFFFYLYPKKMACEVHVVGTILSAAFLGQGSASFCRYDIVSGPGWTVLEGSLNGQTQTAISSYEADLGGIDGSTVLWEHPIEVQFSCATITGWPMIVLTIWRQDEYGRNEICGYGSARIPPCPGLHNIEVACWRPKGTFYQELHAWFLQGGLPHLTDQTMIVLPETGQRHKIYTSTEAVVSLEINVLCKGFTERGIVFIDE